LTGDHPGIIRYQRDWYADHGGTVNARMLMHGREFAGMGRHKFPFSAGLLMPPGTATLVRTAHQTT
jgi:hypothetical protein